MFQDEERRSALMAVRKEEEKKKELLRSQAMKVSITLCWFSIAGTFSKVLKNLRTQLFIRIRKLRVMLSCFRFLVAFWHNLFYVKFQVLTRRPTLFKQVEQKIENENNVTLASLTLQLVTKNSNSDDLE